MNSLAITPNGPASRSTAAYKVHFRFCNGHLDSLAFRQGTSLNRAKYAVFVNSPNGNRHQNTLAGTVSTIDYTVIRVPAIREFRSAPTIFSSIMGRALDR
jgi:hypothetical protein